jgi:hypothetical protein
MKSFFLTLIAILSMLSLCAQNATQNDLQGDWKLVTYVVKGASLDVQTGQVTLSKPESALMEAMGERLKADMESYAGGLRVSSLEIAGNNFDQVVGDTARNGPFTIVEKNGQQYISAKFDNGTSDQIPFKIFDGKLYLSNFDGLKQYIYEKL